MFFSPNSHVYGLSFWHATFSYQKIEIDDDSQLHLTGAPDNKYCGAVCTHPLGMSEFVAGSALLGIFIQFHLALPDPCLCFIWLKCKHPDICKQILKHPGILFLLRKFKSCKLKLPKISNEYLEIFVLFPKSGQKSPSKGHLNID